MTGPYAEAAPTYWTAGWRGILPLPPRRKKNPPDGTTGGGGVDPSYPDIQTWIDGREGNGNVALRMPHNVIGIDVDAYGAKIGAVTVSVAEETWGTLPLTWRSTSRDDGVSGIRLYRVPEGLAWPGELGKDVEIIQRHHRYAVVWPSIHPDTGWTYRWITPEGVVSATVPDPERLPFLPESWVLGLTDGQLATHTARGNADDSGAALWLATTTAPTGQPCARMQAAIDATREDVTSSAHVAGRNAAARAARLADEGHRGAITALEAMKRIFITEATRAERSILKKAVRTEREADKEWRDLVTSAVNLITANPSGVVTCDCDGQITGAILGNLAPVVPLQPAGDEDQDEKDGGDSRLRDGATFILDAPTQVPAVWGFGDEVLWAQGESLMLVGPPGVGKTTLCGQVLRARLGLGGPVLGYGITPTRSRVLYLAMDRPSQIARSLRRTFREEDRDVLADRLRVWEGPPPGDVAKHPEVLLALARLADADTIIIDSVKDAAIGLTEDEVAAAYNRARQTALAGGVEVMELHHLVKRGPNGAKPTQLADVYGSAWLTAGAGSVVLLWGQAGDLIVDWHHLKQPAAEVGPMQVVHDHDIGASTVHQATDVDVLLTAAGERGVTTKQVACAVYGTDDPDDKMRQKAVRTLKKMVKEGRAVEVPPSVGGDGGTTPARWIDARWWGRQSTDGAPTHPSAETAPTGTDGHRRNDANPSRNTTDESTDATDAHDPPTFAPPSTEGGERGSTLLSVLKPCATCGHPAVTNPCSSCRAVTA